LLLSARLARETALALVRLLTAAACGQVRSVLQQSSRTRSEAAPRRGRPGSNTDLKDRLLDGGEINDEEEYEKVPALVKLANQQHMRLVKAGKFDDAQAAFQETQKLFEAADRWADANGTARLRRVEQKHRQHDVLFRTGVQMITAAHRGDSELLQNELRRNRRAEEM
jgi:hypothetical protein